MDSLQDFFKSDAVNTLHLAFVNFWSKNFLFRRKQTGLHIFIPDSPTLLSPAIEAVEDVGIRVVLAYENGVPAMFVIYS